MSDQVKNSLTADEYQELAIKTFEFVNGEHDYMHVVMGIFTEVGEIIDIFKKEHAYKKPVDLVNLQEELGDLLWYEACDEYLVSKNTKPEGYRETGDNIDRALANIILDDYNVDTGAIINYVLKRFPEIDLGKVRFMNIEKLKKRYPDGRFDSARAINRDLDTELNTLKENDVFKEKNNTSYPDVDILTDRKN